MAEVVPFQALRFHSRYSREMDRLTTPPYDVISDREREEYERSHPKNIVRLILPGEVGRVEDGSFYTGAAALLEQYRRDGTLVLDPEPAFYPYRQSFRGPDGVAASRLGFLGALTLTGPEQGGALPHEKTLQAPREDRTRLLLACRANLSPIFLLHPDNGEVMGEVLGRATTKPPIVALTDRKGVRHELWQLDDKDELRRVQEGMRNDWTLIADGHHRYESAQAVMRQLPAEEGARSVLAFFCSLKDRGFRIFPIHRLLRPAAGFTGDRVAELLSARMAVEELGAGSGPEEILARLKILGPGCFGLLVQRRSPRLVRVSPPALRDPKEDLLGSLDPVVLERELLSGLLGMTPEALAGGAVGFTSDAREAARQVESEEAAAAFLLNPLSVEAVIQAARAGLRLPQKSTYFYPKLLTGLVLRPF